jgi:peroxiredoxin
MKSLKITFITLLTAFVWMLPSSFTSHTQGYQVGDMAEDFTLKNIDGKMYSLKNDTTAKGFIVIFTCNHCPYAKAYEDRIIALDKKFKSQGYPVVAINPNDPNLVEEDNYVNMQKRAKEKGFTFPYLIDDKQEVFPKFGATKTPHVYILQKFNNDLIVQYIGAIDDNYEDEKAVKIKYVERGVEALLFGSAPDPSFTKAIGCSIKVKKN